MKIYCLVFSLLFTFLHSYGQIPARSSGQVVTGSNISIFNDPNYSNFSLESQSKVLKYENIEGSPYINNNTGANKNLPLGKFYSPEFKFIESALARYNAYTDDMEVSLLEDGVDYYLLKKEPNFLYIMLGKKTYRAYEYNNGIGFFVILSKSDTTKCVLLKKERIAFKKAEKAESSFVTDTPDSFKKIRDVLYFKFGDLVVEIPKKKKHFHNVFGDKSDEIKEYVKTNSLKITKEKDLLRISRHYNTLR